MVDMGVKGTLALLAVALLLQGTFLAFDAAGSIASSALGALAQELVRELTKVASFFGSILVAIAGLVWEGAKVAVPALGRVAVAGYQAAAPVVGQAASSAIDAATPYVQEATTQLGQAAAPYVDSASLQLDSTLQQATDTLSTALDQSVVSPLRESVGAPIKETQDAITNQVDSFMEQFPPMRAF